MAPKQSSKTSSKLSFEKFFSALKSSAEKLKADEKLVPTQVLLEAGIQSPLVLIGPQQLRLQRIVDWMIANTFKDSDPERYFGPELNSQAALKKVLSSLQSLSLFTANKLSVLIDAHAVRAQYAKKLAPCLTDQPGSSFVIVMAKTMNQQTPLLTSMKKTATIVECSELKGAELRRWVAKEALRVGARAGVSADAVLSLIAAYGGNLSLISNELSKLSLLAEKKAQITKQMVERSLFKHVERSSFDLVQALGRKDLPHSLELTRSLLNQGLHPLQIANFLSRAIRTILANLESRAGLAAEFTNPWFVRKLGNLRSRYSETELLGAISILGQLDLQLKSSSHPPETTLMLAVKRLALREPAILAAA